jgi:ubiquinone/menaquinone biosynthesis C-methylase UbiE
MGNLKLNIEKNYTLWNNVDTWLEGGEEWSKHFETTDNLWDVIILPKIKPYIKGDVLEIAPGHGRITRKLLESNINLDILDLSNTCIERCRKRFGDAISNYYVGNGSDLKDINSNSKDFIISFDSFVHMHGEVINSYLSEINRVLKLGGYCWIHHSNLNSSNENNFENVAGRSNMDINKFKVLAEGHNLKVINQELIKWDAEGNPDWLHDGFSLIKK